MIKATKVQDGFMILVLLILQSIYQNCYVVFCKLQLQKQVCIRFFPPQQGGY